jgi:hypothetical protein
MPLADIDNVTLICLNNPDITIREVVYEIPSFLRKPGMNVTGMVIQSVNALNSNHPHTQTSLGSVYLEGIPLLEKEKLLHNMDRKNILFHAFSLLEGGRKRLAKGNKGKYLKWINRVIEVKAILYKLGLIGKFDLRKASSFELVRAFLNNVVIHKMIHIN